MAAENVLTLIMERTKLAEPKTAFAGVMHEIFPAKFMSSIAMFNVEGVPSRPFDC